MKEKRIFALGFFDGVHLGHQALLRECCRLAQSCQAQAAAVTFDAHPQALVHGEAPRLLSTGPDRLKLLRQYGIGPVYTLHFNQQTMAMPWRSFLDALLEYGAQGFVCGDDFRFGHRGEGNAQKLRQACRELGLPCIVVPEQTVDGIRVSSTHIRSLLERGCMETAVKFLGHPHILSGRVTSGRHLGRTIGVPTANLRIPEGLVCPAFGVYACEAVVEGAVYQAVTNVGMRPTVGGHHVTVESWILDFDGDLYGSELTVRFYKFLRPEKKFASLEELQREIQKNALQTREFFKNQEKF